MKTSMDSGLADQPQSRARLSGSELAYSSVHLCKGTLVMHAMASMKNTCSFSLRMRCLALSCAALSLVVDRRPILFERRARVATQLSLHVFKASG